MGQVLHIYPETIDKAFEMVQVEDPHRASELFALFAESEYIKRIYESPKEYSAKSTVLGAIALGWQLREQMEYLGKPLV